MAIIAAKEAENALFISPREGMIASLNFDSDWTEIRCGAFLCVVDANVENGNNGREESISVADVSDDFTFGIKDAASLFIPGIAGSLFLGIKNKDAIAFCSNYNPIIFPPRTLGFIGDQNAATSAIGYNGTALIDGGEIRSGQFSTGAIYFTDPTPSQSYSGLFVIRFQIENRGLFNQIIKISIAAKNAVEGFDYTPSALQAEMNAGFFGPEKTIAWNDGGSAYPIPDAFYIRLPFYDNRFRICSMRAIKYQPQ